MKKYIFTFLIIFTISFPLFSANVNISNAYMTRDGKVVARFTLSWENSWKDNINRDGVWVFLKWRGKYGDQHLRLLSDETRLITKRASQLPSPDFEVPADQMGLFVSPAGFYEGDLEYTIEVSIDTTGFKSSDFRTKILKVYGIEMVEIPQGPFTTGDPDTTALGFAAFYRSAANGNFGDLFPISSEAAIKVGPNEGELYYRSEYIEYEGDQKGPIPAEFPKGYNAFWCMKYEITQGQYADFLNGIYSDNATYRANFAGIGYYENRGTIRLRNGEYQADDRDRPLNFVSWIDGVAWADWAGLRPMTELEFTKAARGPGTPLAHEFPWNTADNASLRRYHDENGKLIFAEGITEGDRTKANRSKTGASNYGVMDLAGSVWEKVITIGNPKGRAFTGTHGDGKLGRESTATNEDWPLSNWDGGFGYRGGGYYEKGMAYSDFNPHSPIAYRRYGAWSGGPRKVAYGFRCVRTAKSKK